MKKIIELLHFKHKTFWTKEHIVSLFFSIGLLIIALFIQRIADSYVVKTGGIAVGDILLSNIPVIDIDGFIIMITLVFTFLMVIVIFSKPKYILFTIKSLALFVIIRSFFISLTHLGIHPHEITFDENIFGFWLYDLLFDSRNDFFFSGHTGVPFLIGMIIYNEKFWRNICFLMSFILGISVIIGHIHYSIDVFSAPFMTYSIYSISKKLFKKDYKLTT
ncbi:MAG: phosphatase PAP2-related protein [Candidatus Gracilibacteria bacterium]|nr:phosphatase PAP2-related protein [Candidatus Gracilibacteria bacterium]